MASQAVNYSLQIITSVVSDLVIASTVDNIISFNGDLNDQTKEFAILRDHNGIPYAFAKSRIISAGPTSNSPSSTV